MTITSRASHTARLPRPRPRNVRSRCPPTCTVVVFGRIGISEIEPPHLLNILGGPLFIPERYDRDTKIRNYDMILDHPIYYSGINSG